MKPVFAATTVIAALTAGNAFAAVKTITFEQFQHGEIVADEDDPSKTTYSELAPGVELKLVVRNHGNDWKRPDLAVIYDSQESPTTRDPDLVGPPWAKGNLADDQVELGNLLIIQEHTDGHVDTNGNNKVDVGDFVAADDERRRPAGYFDFYFLDSIDTFGFDLVDVEINSESNSAYFATFFNGDTPVGEVNFSSLTGVDGIEWGNNSANRIQRQSIDYWTNGDVETSTRVRIALGGSAGIDNLTFTFDGDQSVNPIPSPTAGLVGLALLGLIGVRRRRA